MFRAVARVATPRRINFTLTAVFAALVAYNSGFYYRFMAFRAYGVVEVEGAEYELDPADETITNTILRDGTWEPAETDLIRAQLKPGDTFVDVGANFGYYTVLASKIVGPTGRVIAFEPDPSSFELLERNVARNGCTNVVLEQKALADKPGTLTLHVSGSNRGAHSLIAFGTPDIARTVDVPAVRLDDYLTDKDGRVDLVKIDTEGAEGFILSGMQETLRRNSNSRLVIEYIPFKLEESGFAGERFMGLLRPHGFRFAEIDEQDDVLRPVTEQDIVAANTPVLRRLGLTNFYLDRAR